MKSVICYTFVLNRPACDLIWWPWNKAAFRCKCCHYLQLCNGVRMLPKMLGNSLFEKPYMYPQRALFPGLFGNIYKYTQNTYTKYQSAAGPAQAHPGILYIFYVYLHIFPNSPQGIELAGDTCQAFQSLETDKQNQSIC